MMENNPQIIILFSGKRKSGKDYVVNLLENRINDLSHVVIRLAGPIKKQHAEENGLDFDKLMGDSVYKEKHRLDMIKWSTAKRNQQPGYFITKAIQMYNAFKYKVWIVSDTRHHSDLIWFHQHYPQQVLAVNVTANLGVRASRGWTFTPGVDDVSSECDLDTITSWDKTVDNSGDASLVESFLSQLAAEIKRKYS